MIETKTKTAGKEYDLEERTFASAKAVRNFLRLLPKSIGNQEDGRQLIRSSGSIGANYIEANESLSKKDFLLRVKIARKEAKESRYWLRLLNLNGNEQLENQRSRLIDEVQQLMNIMGAIIHKSQQ
jgi:four helix bundle protein